MVNLLFRSIIDTQRNHRCSRNQHPLLFLCIDIDACSTWCWNTYCAQLQHPGVCTNVQFRIWGLQHLIYKQMHILIHFLHELRTVIYSCGFFSYTVLICLSSPLHLSSRCFLWRRIIRYLLTARDAPAASRVLKGVSCRCNLRLHTTINSPVSPNAHIIPSVVASQRVELVRHSENNKHTVKRNVCTPYKPQYSRFWIAWKRRATADVLPT